MNTITYMYINILIISVAALTVTLVSSENISEKGLFIQGVDVTKLTDSELQNFCKVLDEELAGKLDLHVFKSTLAERHGRRQKRFIFTALTLFVRKHCSDHMLSARWQQLEIVGAAAAKVYTTYDTMDTAKDVYDTFNSLRPENVESRVVESGQNREEIIMTWEIGDMKVTARSHGPSVYQY